MRRLSLIWAVALVMALVALAGCGTTFHLPESARTPDGAKPAAPPVALKRTITTSGTHIDHAGLALIERFEGFSSCPYLDTVGTGNPYTRGYGETEGITRHSPCISRAAGEEHLRVLIEARYQWAVRGLGFNFNQNEIDALDSFIWNLGAGIFTGTLRLDLERGQVFAASQIMVQYDHAGGVVLEGLRTRRIAEVRLLLTPVAKPKPKPASQIHAERVARLHRDLAYRAALRRLIRVHNCSKRYRHPLHATRGQCDLWITHGGIVNVDITRLEGLLR